MDGKNLDCLRQPEDAQDWNELVAAACPGALADLGIALGGEQLLALFSDLGFYTPPALPFDLHAQTIPTTLSHPEAVAIGQDGLLVSPLQMALAATALSNYGQLPAPKIALAVEQASGGWRELAVEGQARDVLEPGVWLIAAQNLANADLPIWEMTGRGLGEEGQVYTWYLAGSLVRENQENQARCVVILLESDKPVLARYIGQTLLLAALDA